VASEKIFQNVCFKTFFLTRVILQTTETVGDHFQVLFMYNLVKNPLFYSGISLSENNDVGRTTHDDEQRLVTICAGELL